MVSGPPRQRNGRPVPCSKHRHLPACFAGVRLVRQGVRLNISAQSWREPTLMYPVIWVLRSSQKTRYQNRDHQVGNLELERAIPGEGNWCFPCNTRAPLPSNDQPGSGAMPRISAAGHSTLFHSSSSDRGECVLLRALFTNTQKRRNLKPNKTL